MTKQITPPAKTSLLVGLMSLPWGAPVFGHAAPRHGGR